MNRTITLALAALFLAPSLGARPRSQDSAEYRVLDQHQGPFIDLVTTAIRPMALHPDSGRLWAVNCHDSTLVEFDAGGAPLLTARVPWGPVSIAFWRTDEQSPWDVLVVCRNSQALVRLDAGDGSIKSLIPLDSEPADLLVHPGGAVFVALAGVDQVLELDVAAGRPIARYAIPSRRPTFLALHGLDVLVAPMLSGNNSTVDTGEYLLDAGEDRVLDLEDPTLALEGLADHDLFRIVPAVDGRLEAGGGSLGSPSDPRVTPVARDMGAVLFGLGVNPFTGHVWQLGSEANNKDKTKVGELAIRGRIVVNQVSVALLQEGQVVEPFSVINLDDVDLATDDVEYDPTRSIGQPYALAFDAAGDGYITGLLTDNVSQYTAAGAFVREWNVGSIPRGLLVTPDGGLAYVYLWGDNVVERYDLTGATAVKTGTYPLGFDPTPAARQEGRRLFFDASHSMFNNASCASCHVELDSDLLAWDLSDMPYDDKGPLVTQFMRGIEPLAPFHWRGERDDLSAFNGAFDGLLGGVPLDETPGGDFDLFQEYVFSTLQPANPLQDRRRLIVDRGVFVTVGGELLPANAVTGQDTFFDHQITPGVGSCATCHTMPTGTNNEVFPDEPEMILDGFSRRSHLAVASFNGVWRKRQRGLEEIRLADGSVETRPPVGVGVSAAGLKDDIRDFVDIPEVFFANEQQLNDIAAFVEQLDSGVAPVAHTAWLLDGASVQGQIHELRHYLMAQARAGNCDVVVFGEVDLGGGVRRLRWFWDRSLNHFCAEDSLVPDQRLGFFVQQALAGTGSNVLMGLPVGMGRRFGVDHDGDELFNQDEGLLGCDPFDADSDDDGYPDGHEVLHGGDPLDGGLGSNDSTPPVVTDLRLMYVTNRVAKINFTTDEPTVFVAGWTSGAQSGEDRSDLPAREHTVLFTDLRTNNKAHAVTIHVTDHGDNTTQVVVPGGVTTKSDVNVFTVVLRNAQESVVQDSGGTLQASITGTVRFKGGSSQSGRRLLVDVFVNGVLTQQGLLGSTSGGNGVTTVDVVETGLSPGDLVTVVVMGARYNPTGTSADWSMPDTAPQMRRFQFEYTGNGP